MHLRCVEKLFSRCVALIQQAGFCCLSLTCSPKHICWKRRSVGPHCWNFGGPILHQSNGTCRQGSSSNRLGFSIFSLLQTLESWLKLALMSPVYQYKAPFPICCINNTLFLNSVFFASSAFYRFNLLSCVGVVWLLGSFSSLSPLIFWYFLLNK